METEKKNSLFSVKNGLILLAIIGIAYSVSSAIANDKLTAIERNTLDLISEQESLLVAIAEVTARNGGDEVTESIIRDCNISERSRFDELLSKLDGGLVYYELVELERLFGRCGSFYSERKSVMVARMDREIEVYKNLVGQLSIISNKDVSEDYSLAQWENLVSEETKQSELFIELVSSQDKIIKVLLGGGRADSEEIAEILQNAQSLRDSLLVSKTQSDKIRSQLVPL